MFSWEPVIAHHRGQTQLLNKVSFILYVISIFYVCSTIFIVNCSFERGLLRMYFVKSFKNVAKIQADENINLIFFLGKTLLMVGAVSAVPGAIYKRLLEEMT